MGLALLQLAACRLVFFKYHRRDLAVDLGAGQLFQQLGSLFRFGIQEGSKLPLGEQHRAGKAAIVQPRQGGGELQLIFHLIGEDFTVGAQRQLDARYLEVAPGLVAGAVLAPEGAVGHAFYLKLHLGQALGGVAGHQVVLRLRHVAQARRLMIERQADSIQQGGFSRAGGAGDGEQAVAGKRLGGKINLPFPLQGVNVLQAQAEDFHTSCSWVSSSTVALKRVRTRWPCASSGSSSARRRSNTSSTRSSLRVSRSSPAIIL